MFLDTCVLNYIVENNSILNSKITTGLRNCEIIFSVYSVYEIINQKGENGYTDTFNFLIQNFNGFKIQTNDLFKLSDNDFMGHGLNYEDFFKELCKPIIVELKRNIVNRLLVIWFYMQHVYSIIKGFHYDDITLKNLLTTVREKISTSLDNELSKLSISQGLKEKNIKKVCQYLRDNIRYNVWLSYSCSNPDEALSILFNIDFSLPCPVEAQENLLKLRVSDMKQYVPELNSLTDKQIQDRTIEIVRQKLYFENTDMIEEKILEFDLRDIFINDDVFKSNNYMDLFIMRMYLDYVKKYIKATGKDDCYLITADKDFLKRLDFLGNELSIQALCDSVVKSRSYFD